MSDLIPNWGNYKKLISYQKADVIFQITYYFCEHFIERGDRTKDHRLPAAANRTLWKVALLRELLPKQKSS